MSNYSDKWAGTGASPAPSKEDPTERDVASILSGRYSLLSYLGLRDNSDYYLAQNQGTGQTVRLAVLSARSQHNPRHVDLFQLEARAAASLSHSNVLRSGEAEWIGPLLVRWTEHREGVEPLGLMLNRRGWLEPRQAAGIILQIASLLDHAHELGVLHLKLHPGNILLDPGGSVLISDFGIGSAPELSWAHQERSLRCPAAYVSPELLEEGRADYRSDLYSLGVVLFQMLTDRLPFDANSPEQLRRKRSLQSPLPPHLLSPFVPVAISEMVMGLIDNNPGKRFRRASEFQYGLARLVTEDPAAFEVTRDEIEPRDTEEAPAVRQDEIPDQPPPDTAPSPAPEARMPAIERELPETRQPVGIGNIAGSRESSRPIPPVSRPAQAAHPDVRLDFKWDRRADENRRKKTAVIAVLVLAFAGLAALIAGYSRLGRKSETAPPQAVERQAVESQAAGSQAVESQPRETPAPVPAPSPVQVAPVQAAPIQAAAVQPVGRPRSRAYRTKKSRHRAVATQHRRTWPVRH